LEELLSFFTVPQAHWRKVRTIPPSGIIERCFREVRRRTRPISSFTNPAIPQSGTDHLRRHQPLEPRLGKNTLEAIYTIMLTRRVQFLDNADILGYERAAFRLVK
jgi:hypothetical protein